MPRRQQGYTYLGVLLIVLVLGMTLTGATLVADTVRRREKEQELIYAGQQYVDAIRSYYESGEGGVSAYPRSVADLLRDPRFPGVRRHLRKPWRDPMTPSGEWEVIFGEDGGIVGVRSRSRKAPLGRSPTPQATENATTENATTGKPTYRDWQFRFEPAADDDNEDAKRPFPTKGAPIAPRPSGLTDEY